VLLEAVGQNFRARRGEGRETEALRWMGRERDYGRAYTSVLCRRRRGGTRLNWREAKDMSVVVCVVLIEDRRSEKKFVLVFLIFSGQKRTGRWRHGGETEANVDSGFGLSRVQTELPTATSGVRRTRH
jgi:hypothetical protein